LSVASKQKYLFTQFSIRSRVTASGPGTEKGLPAVHRRDRDLGFLVSLGSERGGAKKFICKSSHEWVTSHFRAVAKTQSNRLTK